MAKATYEQLRQEIAELRGENAELRRENDELRGRLEQLEQQNRKLQEQLEQSQRNNKRQAAPFSKGQKKGQKGKPGRKRGKKHGRHAHRSKPDRDPDQIVDVPLPGSCPSCGGELKERGLAHQHQMEIPRQPHYRRFDIHIGQCACCGRRHQPRHELQTSDALGAACSQLGPEAQAAMADMNKTLGLSYGKIQHLFESLFGIQVTRGGCAQAVSRAGARCEGHYEQIVWNTAEQRQVSADETGWRIGGQNAWLHVFTSPEWTCYAIDWLRSFDVAASILGENYAGTLIHDGWAPYDRFTDATHQTCLEHLLRRSREMIEAAVAGAVHFPRAIHELLQEALAIRDRYAAGELTPHGLAVLRGRLESRLDRLLERERLNAANERFAAHLRKHRGQLLTFLRIPGVDATNYRAEQALRTPIVNRKVWGGNRTMAGARVQAILCSTLRTARQQGHDALRFLSDTIRGAPPQFAALLGN